MNPPLHMMHVLNLNTIGGVETLYINFLEYAWKNDSIIPITSICGKKAHPLFHQKMKELRYSPFYERYLYGIYLPKILKTFAHFKRWMLSSVSSTTLSVLWNVIEKKKPATPFLFYDHGASWNYKPSKAYKKFWKDCVGTISISLAAKAMLQHKTQLDCPSYVVPNPLRPDISIRSDARTTPTSPIQLGFVGRLLPLKAPGIAIQTLYDLIHTYRIDARLTIVGVGPEKVFLEKLSSKLHLRDKVTFVPTHEQIELFYDTIDILLVPSLREPLGLVALEASARGVPVLATSVDGLAESVQDGVSGFLIEATEPLKKGEVLSTLDGLPQLVYNPTKKTLGEPKLPKAKDFATYIEKLVMTPGLYEKISAGGIALARERSDFQKYCKDLLHIFHSEASKLAEENDETQQIDVTKNTEDTKET